MTARRSLLLPLVPLYSAALSLKRRFFQGDPRQLSHPVLSVGSLSAGGAGKTPVVAALATLLERVGWQPDILTRGYGRSANTVEQVDPNGTAEHFGDEPLLLARSLGIPVYVGADRHAAGLLAERDPSAKARRIHILDDGFQHRRLARDLDLVLLTAEDAADHLLPAGNLREPLQRLRAASVVILREDEATSLRPVVQHLAGPAMPIWIIRRTLTVDRPTPRPVAFCGIARPAGFFAMLQAQGINPAATQVFPDHHRFRDREFQRLIQAAHRSAADSFLTTAKDAVRLTKAMRRQFESVAPIAVADIEVQFLKEDEVLANVEAAATRRGPLPVRR